MATGPEHYAQAETLTGLAGTVMDADHGWMASLGTGERLQLRTAYLAEAQVHATLALAAAAVDLDDGDIWAAVIR